jgi:hypothetical protein
MATSVDGVLQYISSITAGKSSQVVHMFSAVR